MHLDELMVLSAPAGESLGGQWTYDYLVFVCVAVRTID